MEGSGSSEFPRDFDSELPYSFEIIEESAKYLLDRIKIKPKIGMICGSGLGSIADYVTDRQVFPYEEIPYFPRSTVQGHAGQLVFGYLQGVLVMCMQGRFHYYEGYPLWKCTMPIKVMKIIGVTHLIATHAAGGLNPEYKVGDIMMIKDHINFLGFAGNSALRGPNDDRFGPRFVPLNKAYDPELLKVSDKIAEEMDMSHRVHTGILTCIGGPNFETPAELRMFRMCGVDAVGMSIVHEAIAARHCGLTVFAFSLISNICICDYECTDEANHQEVLHVGKERNSQLQEFIGNIVKHIAADDRNHKSNQ